MIIISLNGSWMLDYLGREPYLDEAEPDFQKPKNPNLPQDAVVCTVPSYFEDLGDLFRTTPLHTKLAYNPLYTLQRYPQVGYVPDMALPNPVGCFLYRRSFTLPEPLGEGELVFGGVQNAASVWLNGHYLGRHEGYSAAFSFKLPAEVLKVGENRLTVAVSNTRLLGYMGRPISGLTSRAASECTGGIWGDVSLRFYPDGLRDLWVTTAEDVASFTVHTEGGEDTPRSVRITDGDRVMAEGVIPPGESAITFPAEGYGLWSPASPKRYTVTVSTAQGALTHVFGIRRLTVRGTRLYLNGKPYYFRGICEHCYHPITVHPTRDKTYYRRVLRTLRELGFNSIRFHTHIPMPEYMEAADELGMLMELETPNNTTLAEWREIVRMARHYTAPVAYSSGNEMVIDEDYIEHLRAAAAIVHSESDSLFSPMSAMRGVEYFSFGAGRVDTPFVHDPVRLAALAEFCDLYNSYSLGATSYTSDSANLEILERRNTVYGKPLLSHEICIGGTYIDLSLADRYRGSRIGDTELFSSVERHLADHGLLDRAPLYYKNSVAWQKLLRKDCFELCRRADTLAGYDFLGDIDTHWHTFGYCVGMMNEFYELKAGETIANVRRYNADAVLLADLPCCRNLTAGETLELPILLSNYGEDLEKATLTLRLSAEERVILRKTIRLSGLKAGTLTELYRLRFTMPRADAPQRITLSARLEGGDTDTENEWELYSFPRVKPITEATLRRAGVTVATEMEAGELIESMARGERVVLLGAGPFPTEKISFQISLAGRTNGHLATVVTDHPLLEGLPHDGTCGHQFRSMMNGGQAVILEGAEVPYRPIIEIATTYKNARREALLFEYRVGAGRLLCCPLRLGEGDPGAVWLRERMLAYAMSDAFLPADALSPTALAALLGRSSVADEGNANAAMNKNDITA